MLNWRLSASLLLSKLEGNRPRWRLRPRLIMRPSEAEGKNKSESVAQVSVGPSLSSCSISPCNNYLPTPFERTTTWILSHAASVPTSIRPGPNVGAAL